MRTGFVLGTNLVLATAALAWVLHRYGTPAIGLLSAAPRYGLLALFLAAVATAIVGYAFRWGTVLRGVGGRCVLARLTAFRAAGQSVSALIPSARLGGEPVRAMLLVRDRVPASSAIASVAVDRTLDMAAGAPFACLYAAVLLRAGVPELQGAFVTVTTAAVALAVGIVYAARRLRQGRGLVTAVARSTGLDRLAVVRAQLHVLQRAEEEAAALVGQPARVGGALGIGLAVNLLVVVEYTLLLRAFRLPAGPLAVVAAIFATGAAHSLPVPAAIGTLEGAQMWLFGMLGHPPEVGLAVGLAVRLRELVWLAPGLVYLLARSAATAAYGRRPQTAPARKPG